MYTDAFILFAASRWSVKNTQLFQYKSVNITPVFWGKKGKIVYTMLRVCLDFAIPTGKTNDAQPQGHYFNEPIVMFAGAGYLLLNSQLDVAQKF